MKPKDILNADMAMLGGWIKSGWHLWLAELHDMIPDKWRAMLMRDSQVIAHYSANETYEFYKNGHLLDILPVRQNQSVILALNPSQVLMRTLSLPKLSMKDLRALIALDMDRLTPFSVNDVLFDIELLENSKDDRKQSLLLAVVPKATAIAVLKHARDSGLSPQSLKITAKNYGDVLSFNFLRHCGGENGANNTINSAQFWWIAAITLFASNIGFAILRDMNETSTLQTQVELQSAAARTGQMLQQRVTNEHQRRQAILQRQSDSNILQLLDTLSQRLPVQAWVQRLSLKDGRIRLIGFAKNNTDIMTILRQVPALSNVQSTSTDVPTELSTEQQPFDITATLRKSGDT